MNAVNVSVGRAAVQTTATAFVGEIGQRALEALLEASGVSGDDVTEDPSGVRHLGLDEAPGSRRGA